MRVHYLQHVGFEGLGSIEPWMLSAGHSVSCTRMYLNEALPSINEFDWLIVMGGPMGVNDEAKLPWLGPEKLFVRRSIDADKRVFGICLGAQMIAAALGARVYKNAHREIGWHPIQRSSGAQQHPLGTVFPERIEAFHWHSDTFDLPSEAVRVASSEGCLNQAFAIRKKVLGLQFHLESTEQEAKSLIENCADDLLPGPDVQSAAQILNDGRRFEGINRLMRSVLQALAD